MWPASKLSSHWLCLACWCHSHTEPKALPYQVAQSLLQTSVVWHHPEVSLHLFGWDLGLGFHEFLQYPLKFQDTVSNHQELYIINSFFKTQNISPSLSSRFISINYYVLYKERWSKEIEKDFKITLILHNDDPVWHDITEQFLKFSLSLPNHISVSNFPKFYCHLPCLAASMMSGLVSSGA